MTDAVLLETQGLVKQFPGVRALDGVDLNVRPGEVHCLLGQNGAGKSTLIKVLAGAHQPDAGEIRWCGEPVTIPTPTAAIRLGISTIYQELDLVDGLSVAENIFLGHEFARRGFSARAKTDRAAGELLDRLGHAGISPRREVGRLPAASKQIVSMARALSHDTRLIIMDEPSAVLAGDEVDNLFRVIRDLTASGVAVVYISHRLDEIRQIGDRVSVLKDGRSVGTGLSASDTPTTEVVSLMTGRSVELAFPTRRRLSGPDVRPVVLRVEGLSRSGEFDGVSLCVHAGEVLGLAGLVGSGRSEILETIYGARKPTAGTVTINGIRLRPGSTSVAVRLGVGLAPEERKSQALLMEQSIARNVSLASLRRFARAGFMNNRAELAAAEQLTRRLDLRPADPRRPVRTLSGGNQQKAVVARWLLRDCKMLLLDEPTRGVDVGARAELYALIRQLADSGVGVLLVSSEVPEVLGLADRVLVLREGRVIRESAATDLRESDVLDLVMSGNSEGGSE